MTVDRTFNLGSQLIAVSEKARYLLIDELPLSTRLRHVLERMGCERLGDLHGWTYRDVLRIKDCGSKTLHELKTLIAESDYFDLPAPSEPAADRPVGMPPLSLFSIPEHARDWPITMMPFSSRVAGILWLADVSRLGDLHDLPSSRLIKVGDCGQSGIAEVRLLVSRVQEGEFDWIDESEPDLRLVLDAFDRVIDKLPTRKREIILRRFGGTGQTELTLRELGAEHNLSAERVRQIIDATLKLILKSDWPLIGLSLKKLAEKCLASVCPLTPETLTHWLGEGAAKRQFATSFYIHLCGALRPEIPAWPGGQKYEASASEQAKEMVRRLEELLDRNPAPLSLSNALDWLRTESPELSAQPSDLLKALRSCKSLLVEFVPPDRPTIKLLEKQIKTKETTVDLATAILLESDRPLSRDEIIERARYKFGEDFEPVIIPGLWKALTSEKGVYLFGRGVYGLRKHFRLPESLWEQARSDFHDLLAREGRPISTSYVVNNKTFEWTSLTTAYELGQILLEDERLNNLGKFLFALRDWGIEQREFVKDLIVKVLEQAGRPMKRSELISRVQQFRSVSPISVREMLEHNTEINEYGFGYYGLQSLGESAKEFLIAERGFVGQIIYGATPPLSFGHLCRILEIPVNGHLADSLWQTIEALPTVRTPPDRKSETTLVRHKRWPLERMICAALSNVDTPVSVPEIQRALNDYLGPFGGSNRAFQITRCLERSRFFIRMDDGRYALHKQLEDLPASVD